MGLRFVLHLCWHLIQKDNGQEGNTMLRPPFFNVFEPWAIIKKKKGTKKTGEPWFYCDSWKVERESGFGIGLHIISRT